ncbi:TlpA family protein disulfide reductase [Candidatus Nitrospira nitrificans]|uniref:Putative Thiol-disulfide oxidoreductase n=1 Tax=Candidatus Nitrospira nitrificans TaxID=1742973 RepID=A0A0S4LE04_9BACT|nr:TlpA disulfide reductase family protein [Candidatus Nitrospira nitrificans]CUS35847.1 putative Thiol-disulfide oxidoreductase [Candidatus Nitrospira nitrificans]
MGSKIRAALRRWLTAGCLVLLGVGSSFHNAAAATSDPFAALRVTRIHAGQPIAAFDLQGLDGGTIRSEELAGKVVLLNFWATWCGPCKEEMPSLAGLQSRFDPAQFQVVTITTDMHPQGIKQFLHHLGIDLPVLFDEREDVSRSFMVRGLPTTVLLTQDGRAIGRAVGPRAWGSEESVALVRHVLEGMK